MLRRGAPEWSGMAITVDEDFEVLVWSMLANQ